MSARSKTAAIVVAATLLVGARLTRASLEEQASHWPKTVSEPFAPSPATAPFLSLGYRELGADLFWLRARVYFGGYHVSSASFRALVVAVIALDPQFLPVYTWAAYGVAWVDNGATQDDYRWVADVLERGLTRFPDRWQLQKAAGETYLLELASDDPDQALAWKTRGVDLLDHAVHNPEAPSTLASYVAYIQSQLGQTQRAIDGLTELIRTTEDPKARQKLIDRLAAIEGASADQIRDEDQLMRDRLTQAWRRALPEAPLEMYFLLGDPPKPYLDPVDWVTEDQVVLDKDLLAPVTDDPK